MGVARVARRRKKGVEQDSEVVVGIGREVRRIACAAVVGMSFFGAASAQAPQFTQFAGGAFGDNASAMAANMQGATDVVADGAGNINVSQFSANRIRKISAAGVVTTLIGGTTGFSGDGGLAVNAAMDRPDGLALDTSGNLYFSDRGNRRVRKIAPNGVITTVAGNGNAVFSGDNGAAVNAGLPGPAGLVVDGNGNLYIADMVNHRVRKVTLGGTITTVAGTGTPGYSGDFAAATSALLAAPTDVDMDAAGNLYITDFGNQAVRKVATNGVINTVFVASYLTKHVSVDGAGSLYYGDSGYCLVYKVSGSTRTKVLGSDTSCNDSGSGGAANTTAIGMPDGIEIDPSGNLLVIDADYFRVRKISTGGIHSVVGGVGGAIANGTLANNAPLSLIAGMAVDASGNVMFSDAGHRYVRKISAGRVYTIGGNGLWVDQGTCMTALPCPGTNLLLSSLSGVALTENGTVLVADYGRARVFSITPDGNINIFAGGTRAGGTGNGDGGPANLAAIDPNGIARDAAGNTYIADGRYNRIRRVDTAGNISTVAGTGLPGYTGDNGPGTSAQITNPLAVATDAAGNVYFNDNLRLRKVAPGGVITTIAGNGTDKVNGDGGLATAAAIGNVRGIAVEANGTIYIAGNGVVRRIRPNGYIDSLPGWTHYAMALAIRNGQLYVGTQEGLVFTRSLAPTRVSNDYDGDGRSDILWRNVSTGANAYWRGANSTQVQNLVGVTNLAWKLVAEGDFDGDGNDDIVWRNMSTGDNTIWRSGNNATQIAMLRVSAQTWQIVGAGDFDKDGKDDLLWRNSTTGQNQIWRSANAATVTAVATVPDQRWKVAGVADFDGDGKADILWRNTATGQDQIWKSGLSTTLQPVSGVTNVAWKVAGVGDFNGDGKADVFWRNTSTGEDVIWTNANVATQRTLPTVTSQAWKVVAVGDYDGDGKADLLWRYGTGMGNNAVWLGGDSNTQLTVTGVTDQAWTVLPYEFQP